MKLMLYLKNKYYFCSVNDREKQTIVRILN